MSIITLLLFSWIFGALQNGIAPAQFTITNDGPVFSGQTHAVAHDRMR